MRRTKKMNATPAWSDPRKIREVYAEAKRIELETGVKMHVDHVIPLRGKTVSGLHVHYNLRPLPAVDNVKKGNRLGR